MASNYLTRRRILKDFAAVGVASILPRLVRADDAKTIKVGILHSLTGILAPAEIPLKDAELLAVAEINAAGGVLGRKIEPIVEDGESKFVDVFPAKAKKLVAEDKTAAVFGLWTSVSRKVCLPVFEENNGLLFYPMAYEGNESSKNVVYAGSLPNQHILPAVDWLVGKAGGEKRVVYPLGSDYVFPRTVNLLVTHHLNTKDIKPTAEKYVPLGHQDFEAIVQDIRQSGADVVVSSLVGDSNVQFFNELAAQKVTPDKTPILSLSLDEDDLRAIEPENSKGHLAAATYFQSVPSERNQQFVKAFRARYGKDRVTTATVAAAYTQVYVWKKAVEKAKSFEVDEVRAVLRGLEFDSPAGKIKVDAKNQHVWQPVRIGRINKERQFDILYESKEWIAPEPYVKPLKPPAGRD
jgi:urea transport system substrate-binding protein